MKKARLLSLFLVLMMVLTLFAGCNGAEEPDTSGPGTTPPVTEPENPETPLPETTFRIAALKGPTAMGMVKMLSDNESRTETGGNTYDAAIYGTADEVAALLIKGDIDVAAVPCNLASVLYGKTEGKVQAAAINTLGVLYIVENGDSIRSIEDLKGKTVYSTGQGTTPEFAFNYVLRQNGIDPENDLTIEYKSESTEIAALLNSTDDDIIALLPQPYVTTVQMQNESVRIALDLTAEWDAVSSDGTLVTGVVVARTEFIEENPAAFEQFLADYAASVSYVNANTAEAAALIEQYDIVKAPVAEKALPFCNIAFIAGDEMQALVGGYLSVLFEQNPNAVGGALPDEGFYYKS